MFNAIWVTPRNLYDPAEVATVLTQAGLDAEAFMALVADPEVKAALVAHNEASVARGAFGAFGAFGAPTFFVGNQMFFGQDRLDFVQEALLAA